MLGSIELAGYPTTMPAENGLGVGDTGHRQGVARDRIQSLPLNGRIFSQLVTLAPGALAAGAADSPEGASGAGARSPIGASVNGLPWSGTSYMMDGVINKEPQNAFINIAPPVEAIEEFKIQTNNPAPEFGFFGGAIVNLTMRSGTNNFHGSAFEYARNSDLNARNFFAARRAPYQSNQFGGTAGGPVVPNRIFFFADYQGLRLLNGQTFTLNVPTLNMRQGLFAPAEGFGPVFDPDSGAAPFPGNRIPASRFDPVSARVAELWPVPNTGGITPAASGPTCRRRSVPACSCANPTTTALLLRLHQAIASSARARRTPNRGTTTP